MSCDFILEARNLSKCYHIYDHPRDRLKQMVLPPLRRPVGLAPKQYFREFWSLRDVSFELSRGESIGVVGRNGAGKSTLLQIITGVLAPTVGSVKIRGRVSALLELGTGFNPEFSGRENISLSLALQGFSKKEIENKFESVVSFADIGSFIDRPVKTYSSGMYSRLAFAVAINVDPDILIVDEILAVGDLAFQQKCLKHLYRMLDDGVSVLLVSHDAYQVRSVCQKALFLEGGRQKAFGYAKDVMDEYIASFTPKNLESQDNSVGELNFDNHSPSATAGVADNLIKSAAFSVDIENPALLSETGEQVSEIFSSSRVRVEFNYRIRGSYRDNLTFVINLYREDGVYIFGTTTKMQGLDSYKPSISGRVTINFPSLPLVSGKYHMRVAVNDSRGLHILAEAVPVCHFKVTDAFKAVGLVEFETQWKHEPHITADS